MKMKNLWKNVTKITLTSLEYSEFGINQRQAIYIGTNKIASGAWRCLYVCLCLIVGFCVYVSIPLQQLQACMM